jgi:hypothetical protein
MSPARLRQRWSVVAALLMTAAFMPAVFAGAMLSGIGWARAAHLVNAVALAVAAIVAGLVAIVTLRRISQGSKLGVTLLSLAGVVFLQAAIGRLSANGANLMWLHVPLGVALVGLAARGMAGAGRLGNE